MFARRCATVRNRPQPSATVRNRPQPFATVRNRSQPFAWGPYGRAYGKFCKRVHCWRFPALRSFISCGRRGTLWHSNVFHSVSNVNLCGTGAILWRRFQKMRCIFRGRRSASGDFGCHFAWQAQHFRFVVLRVFCESHCQCCAKWRQPANSIKFRGKPWPFVTCDENQWKPPAKRRFWGRLIRKLVGKRRFSSCEVWNVEAEVSHEMLVLMLQHVSSRFSGFLLPSQWSMGKVAKPLLVEGFKTGCNVVSRGMRGTLWHSNVFRHVSIPHSTLYIPHFHFPLSTFHPTLYTFHFPLSTFHFPLHTLHFTLYTLHFTLYTLHSLHTLHFPIHTLNLHFTLSTPHFTLHTLTFHTSTPRYPLYTLHSTLYTLHFTLHALHSPLYTLHFTLHTLHFTLRTLHFTLYTITLYTLHSALHSLHMFTLYTPHFTLYTPSTLYTSTLYTLHSTLCTPLHTLHYPLYTWHPTLYTLDSTLYTPHFTLYTPHFALYTPHCKLYTPHFTLPHSTLDISTLYSSTLAHFTLHTSHSTLYTFHSTLYTSFLFSHNFDSGVPYHMCEHWGSWTSSCFFEASETYRKYRTYIFIFFIVFIFFSRLLQKKEYWALFSCNSK